MNVVLSIAVVCLTAYIVGLRNRLLWMTFTQDSDESEDLRAAIRLLRSAWTSFHDHTPIELPGWMHSGVTVGYNCEACRRWDHACAQVDAMLRGRDDDMPAPGPFYGAL